MNSKPRFFVGKEVEGHLRGTSTLFIADNVTVDELIDLSIKTYGQVQAFYFGAGDYRKAPRNIPFVIYVDLTDHVWLTFEIDDLSEIKYIPVLPKVSIVLTAVCKTASWINRVTAFKAVDDNRVYMLYPEGRSFSNKLDDTLYESDKEITL